MMDRLVTFRDTQSVLQAEQILIRRKIPFETVPYSHFNRSGCGLAILFSNDHYESLRRALNEVQLEGEFIPVDSEPPGK